MKFKVLNETFFCNLKKKLDYNTLNFLWPESEAESVSFSMFQSPDKAPEANVAFRYFTEANSELDNTLLLREKVLNRGANYDRNKILSENC